MRDKAEEKEKLLQDMDPLLDLAKQAKESRHTQVGAEAKGLRANLELTGSLASTRRI